MRLSDSEKKLFDKAADHHAMRCGSSSISGWARRMLVFCAEMELDGAWEGTEM